MGDFVTLTCPTCGGRLQITPDIDRFACTHCGNEHLVKRSEGLIAIQPLTESLTGLKRATDRTASELAIRRLTDELSPLLAAKQQAETKAAGHRKVIADHDAHKMGCQAAAAGPMLTGLCYLAYLATSVLTEDLPEDSLLGGLPYLLLIMVGCLGLVAIILFLKWAGTNEPTPNRVTAEQNLKAAEAEVAALAQAISQKQAEIAQHQQLVRLGS